LNQENEAKASENVRRIAESGDLYHDKKPVGGLEKVSSPAITKPTDGAAYHFSEVRE